MLGDILKALIGPILEPLIARIPDPNERARAREAAEASLITGVMAIVQGQLEINKVEAQHTSIFVAGWRPAIGWICGAALAWNFVIHPMLLWVAWIVPEIGADLNTAPRLDTGELMTVLLGMLGLGTMRTFEKRIGVARSTMGKDLDK
jgi:hypothetical protein